MERGASRMAMGSVRGREGRRLREEMEVVVLVDEYCVDGGGGGVRMAEMFRNLTTPNGVRVGWFKKSME